MVKMKMRRQDYIDIGSRIARRDQILRQVPFRVKKYRRFRFAYARINQNQMVSGIHQEYAQRPFRHSICHERDKITAKHFGKFLVSK